MIEYIHGDIFSSPIDMLIVHQVNCMGVMGAGVAKQVKEYYPEVYESYRRYCEYHHFDPKILLGNIEAVSSNDRIIVNFFSQGNYGNSGQYTSYEAFQSCLDNLKKFCVSFGVKDIAFPYLIGCHRGGGKWEVVEEMIGNTLAEFNVKIYIYDLG